MSGVGWNPASSSELRFRGMGARVERGGEGGAPNVRRGNENSVDIRWVTYGAGPGR